MSPYPWVSKYLEIPDFGCWVGGLFVGKGLVSNNYKSLCPTPTLCIPDPMSVVKGRTSIKERTPYRKRDEYLEE